MRPFWTGAISFGLVNIPIRLFPATKSHDVDFRLIHKADGSPVRYQTMCAAEEKAIDRGEIVKGVELGDDRVIVFEPDELEAIQERTAPKLIEIQDFVDLADVDPVYFQKAYYAGPQPGASRAFGLLREAMLKSGKTAIARFGLRTKTHLAAIRPLGPGLALETMYYHDEVADPEGIPGLAAAAVNPREMELAELLISNLSRKWEPARYKDQTRQRLEELIEKKLQGQIITAPAPPPETRVEELMAALERSLRGLELPEAPEPEPAERPAEVFQAAEPAPKPRRKGKES